MRLALISDIHGNNVALEAVLTAISTQNITQVICLGDVASTGPQPCKVIKRLRGIGCPVVMGNMDVWLLQPEPKEQPDLRRQRWQEMDLWCAGQLSSVDRAYLRSFQPGIEYPLLDGKTLVCYHGSPRSYDERLWDASCSLVGQPLEGGVEMAISPHHTDLAEVVEKACQADRNIFGYHRNREEASSRGSSKTVHPLLSRRAARRTRKHPKQ